MNNTKIGDIERLNKLQIAGAITETEFKLLKKQIMGELSSEIDNNVYKSVKIGEQEWMAENLNVDHFRNGDIIPEAKTNEEWIKAGEEKQPAWCYYNNNSSNGEKYGKLYNFYAVSDPRGLAPKGWHVPTDAEWTVLTGYLYYVYAVIDSGAEGTALKATSGWIDFEGQSANGTDDYEWNGLPGGERYGDGDFSSIGYVGLWWSSSQRGEKTFDKERNTGDAWYRDLSNGSDYVYRYSHYKDYGFSVRCLRD